MGCDGARRLRCERKLSGGVGWGQPRGRRPQLRARTGTYALAQKTAKASWAHTTSMLGKPASTNRSTVSLRVRG